jgi:hypothetical protein
MKPDVQPDKLVQAREALSGIWDEALVDGFRGRTWGSQTNPDNPYRASNITMAIGDEVVVINRNPQGDLVIHTFLRADTTDLGERVRTTLSDAGLIE